MTSDDVKTPAPSDVAEEVSAFYERHPYPPPVSDLDKQRELAKDPVRRRAFYHLHWPAAAERSDLEILVAGCGTSQAARYALREPGARITAIDISETSLRHSRELKQKYRLENLELQRLSLERVGDLGRTFDLVVCTGVLHHLADPDAGLRALREVVKPQGAMRVMVYAAYGRAGLYMMQAYCRLLEIGTTAEDLQSLADTLRALPSDHPMAGVLSQAKDMGHPDALADALLHPQDRAYTVPELYDWLARCKVTFGRWFQQAPYLPQCGIMARLPHFERLAALPAPAQHAAVELFRGTMTRHDFIAYRDDRPNAAQPIAFDRAGWQDYVPLRRPGSVAVREQVPAGAAAVLVDRARSYRDLFLPLDAAEERLVRAIDGRRTIADIAATAASAMDRKEEACGDGIARFFERLWHNDHVVFDLSRSGNRAS